MIPLDQAEGLAGEALRRHFSSRQIPEGVVERLGWSAGLDGSGWVIHVLLYDESCLTLDPTPGLERDLLTPPPQVAVTIRVDGETRAVTLTDTGVLDSESKRSTARSCKKRDPIEFDVILTGTDGRKIQAMKAVRELIPLGLKEARDAVENPPLTVKKAVPREQALAAQEKLQAAGARVEIQPVR